MNKFLICVDTSDPKKRQKLNKILLRFGERVQYSVFEFLLNETDELKLKSQIKTRIKIDNTIQINIYYLPENYILKIERLGTGNIAPITDAKSVYF